VPASFIPKLVKEAFTSAEDRNFYNHPGIDPSGILRAAIKDVGLVLEGRRPQGASTITQQVARLFLLNSELKMARKIREAILAIRIDATYPKEKTLELYLNEINLGQNSYGVGAAALNYFGKSLDELTISEVAFLAALPKSPAHYDPRFHHQAALDRRNWVIGQMEENNYVTDEQARAAKAEPLITQTRALGSQAADVDYYVEEVRRLLYKQYGGKGLYDSGLQVRASLDTRLQNYAVSALRTGLCAPMTAAMAGAAPRCMSTWPTGRKGWRSSPPIPTISRASRHGAWPWRWLMRPRMFRSVSPMVPPA
jgi:penicillin-binding protein 1A